MVETALVMLKLFDIPRVVEWGVTLRKLFLEPDRSMVNLAVSLGWEMSNSRITALVPNVISRTVKDPKLEAKAE